MFTRRDFIKSSGLLALGSVSLPQIGCTKSVKNPGIQLYTFRKEMLENPRKTLEVIAKLGYKELESARSDKGHYYGLTAKEMKAVSKDLGLTLRSGHVHIDQDWQKTVNEAAESGQEYVICSSMPTEEQTVSNYRKTADIFNKAAEECKKNNLKFGYHNHDYEFEKVDGKVLYDILLTETDAGLVDMELDLGWVVATGNDPIAYFNKYPDRFPLWHLKDMKKEKNESTEFGKGKLNIAEMFKNGDKSGMKYFFVEQEEYLSTPEDSAKHNIEYLKNIHY